MEEKAMPLVTWKEVADKIRCKEDAKANEED